MEVKTIIPDRAFLIHNVFTEKECQELIDKTEKKGYMKLKDNYNENDRNNTRMSMEDTEISKTLWSRIKELIPLKTITNNSDEWFLCGLNPLYRFCKYEPGQYFKMHLDGSYQSAYNIKSWLTCNIYLNDNFEGGNTNFYDENKKLIYELKPETGLVLLFIHDTFHEGAELKSGLKYLMRTDVMYIRTAYKNYNKENLMAKSYQMIKEAEKLEVNGDKIEAMKLFNQAYQMESTANNMK